MLGYKKKIYAEKLIASQKADLCIFILEMIIK